MASSQSTVDFIAEQIQSAGFIRTRKMFGEYAIYCNEKVVAFVCDDQLFVKPTEAGKALFDELDEAPPYPGAKNYYRVTEERWEDHEWLTDLIIQTAAALPLPKPKKLPKT
jgi:TfoX/Sxy family transcriptional regulator of competence genes